MNYDQLSKKRIIELLNETTQLLTETKENYENELKNKEKEISKLTIELRDTRIELNKLLIKYENKQQRILRDTYNKFVSQSEHLTNEDMTINEAELKQVKKVGRKANGTNYATNIIPTSTVIKDLTDEEKICDNCNEVMISIGEDKTIKIVRHKARYEAIEVITRKYACKTPTCDSKVKQVLNEEPFGNSAITSSVAADIVNMKYNLGVPLDRYSKYLSSQNIKISTQCLSNYVIKTAELLTVIYENIKLKLVNNLAGVIYVDETPLDVLEVKDKSTCYMFVYTTSFYDKPAYLYDFSITRETTQTKELLGDYKGYLVCDGYKGYNIFKDGNIKGTQRCMAHVRRYFFDIIKPLKEDERKKSSALKVVNLIDKIFTAEKKYKESKYSVEEIKENRNTEYYQNMIDNLHSYVWSLEARPNSLLDKAIKYTKNAWDNLFTYRESGYIEPSNNICERAVKPFVIGRKNWLFSKTVNGAQASAILYSIIQTAKANCLIIDSYLEYVLDNIKTKDINDLLPWSDNLPNDLRINLIYK